ncbi:hypothetical protein ACFCVQ_29765, partial [Bacillus thuringiensis]|uniref:hypothetical protein n=1 Tax=Bacillus thuringiensis TaxID=1428 RepID=UPI0035D641CB
EIALLILIANFQNGGAFFTIKSISAAYFCCENSHSYFDSDMGRYTCPSTFYYEVALEYIVFY